MKLPIPYGRHFITEEDIQAVVDILRSEHLTQGPKISEFEKYFAERMGAKYAVAVANGTAALHLSCLALNLAPGDRVITTPLTFVASANCVVYCGAEVDFVDIDPKNFLIDLQKLKKLLQNSPKGTYKGIITVDFAGYSTQGDQVRTLANEHGLWVIEDASHAPGATFRDQDGQIQKVGGHGYSDLTTFSFHPVKHIAAGEGGIITTNDLFLYEKLLLIRSHGIIKDPHKFINKPHGSWYYEMQVLGFNYRMSDIHAALAHSQLKRLEQNIATRQALAKRYLKGLAGLPLILPYLPETEIHALHLFIIQTSKRDQLFEYLYRKMIYVQVHYMPVPMHPVYQRRNASMEGLVVASNFYQRCLSLPLYDSLALDEQDYVIEEIKNFFRNFE